MANVTIYTTANCPYCQRAKALLSGKGIPFKEIDLGNKPDELKALKERTGWKTVPQIFIGEQLIGGYQELTQLDAKGELEKRVMK